MTDLQATLDAIDEVAVHECGQCRRPLRPDGPSPDFCGPWCQEDWLREKQEVVELVGYREPCDLPVHAFNLVELSSPETTPALSDEHGFYGVAAGSNLRFRVEFDATPMLEAFERIWESTRIIHESLHPDPDRVRARLSAGYVIFDEGPRFLVGVAPLSAAVRALPPASQPPTPLTVQIKPEQEATEPFGADFDFEHRPATTLPGEPPPAVMPALPERDWQALVDARTRSGPEQRPRAPRQLGRRAR